MVVHVSVHTQWLHMGLSTCNGCTWVGPQAMTVDEFSPQAMAVHGSIQKQCLYMCLLKNNSCTWVCLQAMVVHGFVQKQWMCTCLSESNVLHGLVQKR